MPELALTKTADPRDYEALAGELAIVDHVGIDGQHAMRRWEYAMALRAFEDWPMAEDRRVPPRVADVGGAGSTFHQMVRAYMGGSEALTIDVIDPKVNQPVETYSTPYTFDVIFALSVLEHVGNWRAFLRACVDRLAPGGLFFLTVDYWDAEGPDTAHFHWMRERIYNRESITDVYHHLRSLGCQRFGEADWTYHGHQLFGSYTFCSLAVLKKESPSCATP